MFDLRESLRRAIGKCIASAEEFDENHYAHVDFMAEALNYRSALSTLSSVPVRAERGNDGWWSPRLKAPWYNDTHGWVIVQRDTRQRESAKDFLSRHTQNPPYATLEDAQKADIQKLAHQLEEAFKALEEARQTPPMTESSSTELTDKQGWR